MSTDKHDLTIVDDSGPLPDDFWSQNFSLQPLNLTTRILPVIRRFTGTWIDLTGNGERLMLDERDDGTVDLLWYTKKDATRKVFYGSLVVTRSGAVAGGLIYDITEAPVKTFWDKILRREPKPKPWGWFSVHYLNQVDVCIRFRRAQGGAYGYRMNQVIRHLDGGLTTGDEA